MRAQIKPSKPTSLISIVVGIGMAIFGVFLIPQFGWFGVLWVGGVLLMVFMNVLNLSSPKGISMEDIDIENPVITTQSKKNDDDFEHKLRKLESLKKDNLITEDEYKKKRAEVMKRDW